jgi:1-acyl-sn-glycerol-3-phosphate acyltransferase
MYSFIRFFVRLALKIYCCRIRVNDESFLDYQGPLILASNHPNSFLDAIMLASFMKQPVHFLALGESTDRYLFRWILVTFRIIPVYRLKENRNNQERNEISFRHCADVLLNHGTILIFSEGICENNWLLRPIKKATARIVLGVSDYPEMQSRLRILPVGLNYNSYSGPGKMVIIQFGEPILIRGLATGINEAERMQLLNDLLKLRLSDLMLQTADQPEIVQMMISNCPDRGSGQIKNLQEKLPGTTDPFIFSKLKNPGFLISADHKLNQTVFMGLILALPAALGWIIHSLIYYPLKLFIKRKTSQSVYYDSVLFTGLFLAYPIYWIACNLIVYVFLKNLWIQILFICMPLLAWITVVWKEYFQRVRNYFILSKPERKLFSAYFI